MPNRNYINGRRKEYKIMQKLRDLGCDIVLRSAGSHSPIDVIGINKIKKEIYCYQSKPESMSDNEKHKLFMENVWLNGLFLMTFEVV